MTALLPTEQTSGVPGDQGIGWSDLPLSEHPPGADDVRPFVIGAPLPPDRTGEVVEQSPFGDPVDEDVGDWCPLTEAAEVTDLTIAALLHGLGRDLVRWRVVVGHSGHDLELWLPDVLALPGARW
jgi:hypothetical protein